MPGVVGREPELKAVDAFLDGTAQALAIVGEPGIGKTTVWREAVERARARGATVLVARPAESEVRLSFGGVADLTSALPAEAFDSLPAPQRRGLDVALLRADSAGPPARRVVATALLTLLRELAAESAVVIAIDDLQWLDPPSAVALEFALRRLEDENVRVIFSMRTDAAEPAAPGDGADRDRTAFGRGAPPHPERRNRPDVRAAGPDSHRRGVGGQPVSRDRDRTRARAPRGAGLHCAAAGPGQPRRARARACASAACADSRCAPSRGRAHTSGHRPRRSDGSRSSRGGRPRVDRRLGPRALHAPVVRVRGLRGRCDHAAEGGSPRPCGSRRRSDRARTSSRSRERRSGPGRGRRARVRCAARALARSTRHGGELARARASPRPRRRRGVTATPARACRASVSRERLRAGPRRPGGTARGAHAGRPPLARADGARRDRLLAQGRVDCRGTDAASARERREHAATRSLPNAARDLCGNGRPRAGREHSTRSVRAPRRARDGGADTRRRRARRARACRSLPRPRLRRRRGRAHRSLGAVGTVTAGGGRRPRRVQARPVASVRRRPGRCTSETRRSRAANTRRGRRRVARQHPPEQGRRRDMGRELGRCRRPHAAHERRVRPARRRAGGHRAVAGVPPRVCGPARGHARRRRPASLGALDRRDPRPVCRPRPPRCGRCRHGRSPPHSALWRSSSASTSANRRSGASTATRSKRRSPAETLERAERLVDRLEERPPAPASRGAGPSRHAAAVCCSRRTGSSRRQRPRSTAHSWSTQRARCPTNGRGRCSSRGRCCVA